MMSDFSKRLKELREEHGFTRTHVAQSCGVSVQCISSLEMGERNPTGSTLNVLADFFDCSIDYLMGREDDLGILVQHTVGREELTSQEKLLLNNFRKLDLSHRIRVLGYVDAFLEKKDE